MAVGERVPVRFNRTYANYNTGEVAGFPPEEAAKLIASGVASDATEQDPATDPEVVQVMTGQRLGTGQVILGGVPVNPPIFPPRPTGMGATTRGTQTPADVPVNPSFTPGPGIRPSQLPTDPGVPLAAVTPTPAGEPAGSSDVAEPDAADPDREPHHPRRGQRPEETTTPEEPNLPAREPVREEPEASSAPTQPKSPSNPGTKATEGPPKDKVVDKAPVKK